MMSVSIKSEVNTERQRDNMHIWVAVQIREKEKSNKLSWKGFKMNLKSSHLESDLTVVIHMKKEK